MKRCVFVIACICMFLAISAGSAWAEWEGNAGIASASEFPQAGMYARSDLFPKNTVVEIRNLETEITVRAVITGTAGVPGLVAVLSPLTASTLQIRTGSVSRVRISVPSPVSERPAPGTIASGTGVKTSDPDVNPSSAAAAAAAAAAASTAAISSTIPGTAAPVTPQPVPAEIPFFALANASEDPLVPLAEPAPVAVLENRDTINVPETSLANTEAAPEASLASIIFIDEPTLVASDLSASDLVAPVIDSDTSALSEGGADPEFAVTLIPAEPNPPASPVLDVPSDIPEVGPVVVVSVPVEKHPVPVFLPEVPALSSVQLPYITSFIKGGYYVQIASYSDPLNAQKVVNNYAKKYPVAVELSATKGREVLKVFIGPIKKDEYGAVLERFKSLGFKDAFVQKGQ